MRPVENLTRLSGDLANWRGMLNACAHSSQANAECTETQKPLELRIAERRSARARPRRVPVASNSLRIWLLSTWVLTRSR